MSHDTRSHPGQFMTVTDRGSLWQRPSDGGGNTLVRLIDAKFCDLEFREAVKLVQNSPHTRWIPIINAGWEGDRFRIVYRLDSPWEFLEQHFQNSHWRTRLETVRQICGLYRLWSSAPVRPLGLSVRNIIVSREGERQFPWLLPCPPLRFASPHDLFGLDYGAIAGVAPEVFRCITTEPRLQEGFSLGHLASLAIGCRVLNRSSSEEALIELLACGGPHVRGLATSALEPFLAGVDELQQLTRVLEHYTQSSAVARPKDSRELESACTSALGASNPLAVATRCASTGRVADALRILDWGFGLKIESVDARSLAADLCEGTGDFHACIRHLDIAIVMADQQVLGGDNPAESIIRNMGLRHKRCEVRWKFYRELPPLSLGKSDPEGDALLEDLTFAKQFQPDGIRVTVPYMRAAKVYRRRGDLGTAAQELYAAAELEPAELDVLHEYGTCLHDILGQFVHNAGTDSEKTATARKCVEALVAEARWRIERMVASDMLDPEEADKWRSRFEALISGA